MTAQKPGARHGAKRAGTKHAAPESAGTRERIVDAGAELLRRQGYNATGVKQIVERASATLGSVYHFFPGGKEELGAEAIRASGLAYGELIGAVFDPAPDVVTAVRNAFAAAAENLAASDYADACPIATVALEVASTSERLRVVTHEIFEGWLDDLEIRFRAAGVPRKRARETAIAVLSLLEGAFVLARAARNVEPLDATGRAAVALTRDAVAGGG